MTLINEQMNFYFSFMHICCYNGQRVKLKEISVFLLADIKWPQTSIFGGHLCTPLFLDLEGSLRKGTYPLFEHCALSFFYLGSKYRYKSLFNLSPSLITLLFEAVPSLSFEAPHLPTPDFYSH